MVSAALIDLCLTVLIYRFLFGEIELAIGRTPQRKALDFAARVGLAWIFPLLCLWLFYAMGLEGIIGLFGKTEVID